MTHLSSSMSGVDEVVPLKLDFVAADRSNSRKYGKPPKYGSNCGPRNIVLSANIAYYDKSKMFFLRKCQPLASAFYNPCFNYIPALQPFSKRQSNDIHTYQPMVLHRV